MDVFKELIDELKDENLLERTVISDDEPRDVDQIPDHESFATGELDSSGGTHASALCTDVSEIPLFTEEPLECGATAFELVEENITQPLTKDSNKREVYKKRAVGEMTHLQMVEHVLTGVEREYMKIVPKAFDDFGAKKALNTFLKVFEGDDTALQSQAELAMMEETESWCSALAARDRAIPVASVRQYCENSRPALSSQALVALARFYRNVPFCEPVRSKFDFVMTRLFSKQVAGNKRVCLFTRVEMLDHISLLYKEWSSVPLYAADDESKVLLTALSFEELANEAENASTFDLLIANDFFGRLGMFKESVSELFFAPNVTAAAIDCNVRVGNAYVTLINNERVKMDTQTMFSKFSGIDSLIVSDAAARTLEIVDILRKHRDISPSPSEKPVERPSTTPGRLEARPNTLTEDNSEETWKDRLTTVRSGGIFSSPLLITAVLLLTLAAGYFGWTALQGTQVDETSARTIELPNSALKKHLKTVRVEGTNFYGLLLPTWNDLSKEKREEFLRIVYDFAKEKGCTKVELLDSEGKPAATGTPSKVELK